METKDDRYNALHEYVQTLHEKNKKRVKASCIILVLLPVALELIRLLTDSDKTVFLAIWIFCMFAISVYLVSVEYLDHVMQKRLGGVEAPENLVPTDIRGKVKEKLEHSDAEDTEEGGDE